METKASISGHPFHPMLIIFPLGLWVFSFICCVIFKLCYLEYSFDIHFGRGDHWRNTCGVAGHNRFVQFTAKQGAKDWYMAYDRKY